MPLWFSSLARQVARYVPCGGCSNPPQPDGWECKGSGRRTNPGEVLVSNANEGSKGERSESFGVLMSEANEGSSELASDGDRERAETFFHPRWHYQFQPRS